MPELPEVETVRRGLAALVVGRRIATVEVAHPRAVRRHAGGPGDFAARLSGRVPLAACRRGKFLWLPLDSGESLLAHLGMSGQLLVTAPGTADGPHLRVRARFCDGETELRFVDQRTFGGLAVGAGDPPIQIAHIASDPLAPGFDDTAFAAALRRRRSAVKRALLDQTLVSGIGNIYADEALWRARIHWARPADTLTRPQIARLLTAVRSVLAEATNAGGTSFDSLYVNVNGQSGRFDRSLDVYGREDRPCRRCAATIRREPFANRSAYACPRCQRPPRPRRVVTVP